MSKFALLFIGILLTGLGAALFYHGWAAFLLYEITYFMNPDDRWWSSQLPGISYSFWTAILMIAVLIKQYRELSQRSPWRSHPVFLWMVALLGSYYLAYFWALEEALHEQFTFIFLKLIVIVLVAYKLLDSEKALNGAIWAFLLGCTYVAYLATSLGRNAGARLEGISLPNAPDVNGVANALVPAGALLMYFAWMGSKKVRLLCFICGGLIANALVLFNSRGAFLGIVVSAGLYMLFMMFSRHRQKGQRGMAIVILVVGVSGGLYVTDAVFWERMSTLQNVESRDSGAGRVVFWMPL
ncbi:hypothetical protein CF392_16445 [Tamilnaduibacter salinus]|uniref:Polymerase n=1 Tax=Tamilnaduibacter salinus TaxID=1484056 RepID=A0A2A2I075_9GAMM|nr:hypothetical protein CF392_16445 [Tamilnaduibacter salinus]